MTGTLPRFRGRGLATLVKVASMHWAREHGIEAIMTANAEENAPMLAVNRKLGYRPFSSQTEYVKSLFQNEHGTAGPR